MSALSLVYLAASRSGRRGLWLSTAHVDPIVDLSAPQKFTPLPFLIRAAETHLPGEQLTQPYAPVAVGTGGPVSDVRPQAQHVAGYTRNDGTYVRPMRAHAAERQAPERRFGRARAREQMIALGEIGPVLAGCSSTAAPTNARTPS